MSAPDMTEEARRFSRSEEAWRNLDFVKSGEGMKTDAWAPPTISVTDDGQAKGYATANDIGALYALQLVAHMRDFPDMDAKSALLHVLADMVKHGQWEGVEIGFASGLADILVDGCVKLSVGYNQDVVAVVQAA